MILKQHYKVLDASVPCVVIILVYIAMPSPVMDMYYHSLPVQ